MSPNKYFLTALGIVSGYVGIRVFVYRTLPVTSLESWFHRDLVMCIPRIAAFSMLLFLMRKQAPLSDDWNFRDWWRAPLWGAIPFALWLYFFMNGAGERFASSMALIGILSSLCVALLEETAFRGVLFDSFRVWGSPHLAIFGASFLFTIFHFQAQAIETWPVIFMVGIIFGALRMRGMTLAGLVFIHAAIDSIYFFAPSDSSIARVTFPGMILGAGLFLYALVIYPYSCERSRESNP